MQKVLALALAITPLACTADDSPAHDQAAEFGDELNADGPDVLPDPLLAKLDHIDFSGANGVAVFTLRDALGFELGSVAIYPAADGSLVFFAEYDDGDGLLVIKPTHEVVTDSVLPGTVLASRARAIGELVHDAEANWSNCGISTMVTVAMCWTPEAVDWACSGLATNAACDCLPKIINAPKWLQTEC